MLIFSTICEIDSSLTKDKFIELVIEWNQKSPFMDNVIENIVWNGERNIKFGNDRLWLDIEEFRKNNTIAVRYAKYDPDGVVWKTDYIMNFTAMRMAIRLDRSYTKDSSSTATRFSTPHFIKLLIDKGYSDMLPPLSISYLKWWLLTQCL